MVDISIFSNKWLINGWYKVSLSFSPSSSFSFFPFSSLPLPLPPLWRNEVLVQLCFNVAAGIVLCLSNGFALIFNSGGIFVLQCFCSTSAYTTMLLQTKSLRNEAVQRRCYTSSRKTMPFCTHQGCFTATLLNDLCLRHFLFSRYASTCDAPQTLKSAAKRRCFFHQICLTWHVQKLPCARGRMCQVSFVAQGIGFVMTV